MNLRSFLHPTLPYLLLPLVFLISCTEEENQPSSFGLVADYNAEASLEWNKLFLELDRYAAGYRPSPASRALAHLGLAAYEACIAGMPGYNSLENQFYGLQIPKTESGKEYHWPSVVHGVYTDMTANFFAVEPPSDVRNRWNALVKNLDEKYLAQAGPETFNRSKLYGQIVGQAVWNWSTTDPYGHDAYKSPFTNYTTGETFDWAAFYDGPGDWKPTIPGPTGPLFPFFGKARAFTLTDNYKLCLPPTNYYMEYSESQNSEYYSQALQVYSKNATLDYTTEWIGEYWSDDLLNLTFSPASRWIAIGTQVIENDRVNLETAIEAYAKIGIAVFDANVACWNSKYHYNVERPVTYIQHVIDPTYRPNLDNPLTGDEGITPPTPAYPSGHATMGAAAAEALSSVFGYAYTMTDRCHFGRIEFEGIPRTFGSFYEMALENAWSRVLLGVHWRMDADEGVRFGTVIGRRVNQLPWKK